MVCIHVRDNPDEYWEPHFVGFLQVGKYHFGFGGEDGAQLVRIPRNMLETVFFDPRGQNMLLNTIGKSWKYSHRYLNAFDSGILYLPKAYLKPPNKVWNRYSLPELIKLKTLEYRVGKYQKRFRHYEHFMFQAITSDKVIIKTLDKTELEKTRLECNVN